MLSLAAIPAGVVLARQTQRVTLVDATGAIPVAFLLGWIAVLQARRARERIQITLGRAGGEGAARAGRVLGIVAVLLSATAALAVGFWGLLTLFAK